MIQLAVLSFALSAIWAVRVVVTLRAISARQRATLEGVRA
jgi:hypothetical protein